MTYYNPYFTRTSYLITLQSSEQSKVLIYRVDCKVELQSNVSFDLTYVQNIKCFSKFLVNFFEFYQMVVPQRQEFVDFNTRCID